MNRALLPGPFGDLVAVHDGEALTSLYFASDASDLATPSSAVPLVRDLAEQLDRYYAGELRRFGVPLRLTGTPFQLDVWSALQRVPFGETLSYAALARALGRPTAARAVGRANGANPIAIIVPCHRVVGSDGSPTGYAGGIERKQSLLRFERDALASANRSGETFQHGSVAAHT